MESNKNVFFSSHPGGENFHTPWWILESLSQMSNETLTRMFHIPPTMDLKIHALLLAAPCEIFILFSSLCWDFPASKIALCRPQQILCISLSVLCGKSCFSLLLEGKSWHCLYSRQKESPLRQNLKSYCKWKGERKKRASITSLPHPFLFSESSVTRKKICLEESPPWTFMYCYICIVRPWLQGQ